MKWPKHKYGMYIEHNPHKDVYESIDEYLKDREMDDTFSDFIKMQRAIDTNELWTMQWYPETPVGFICISAPTFEELMEYALEDCDDN